MEPAGGQQGAAQGTHAVTNRSAKLIVENFSLFLNNLLNPVFSHNLRLSGVMVLYLSLVFTKPQTNCNLFQQIVANLITFILLIFFILLLLLSSRSPQAPQQVD